MPRIRKEKSYQESKLHLRPTDIHIPCMSGGVRTNIENVITSSLKTHIIVEIREFCKL